MRLIIANYDDLIGFGMDIYNITQQLIKMDYDYIDGLLKEDVGELKQWVPILRQNIDTWRVLLDDDLAIIGYWCFQALKDDIYNQCRKGQLLDESLTEGNVVLLDKSGQVNIYIVGFCISAKYQKGMAFYKLFTSMMKVLNSLMQRDILVNEVIANAYTKVSNRLCSRLGFKYLCDHKNNGKIYSISLEELIIKSNTAKLLNRYRDG